MDTISLLASFLAPVSAVGITLWYQSRERVFQRKLDVFRALMKHRRHWLNPEWVGALNLVPVEFHKDSKIINAFNTLLDRLGDVGWIGDDQAKQRVYENAETAANELFLRIAKNLRIDLSDIDLRSRIYAPQGWQDDESIIKALRDEALKLIRGENRLRVDVENTLLDRSEQRGAND